MPDRVGQPLAVRRRLARALRTGGLALAALWGPAAVAQGQAPARAPLNDAFVAWQARAEAGAPTALTESGYPLGYVPGPIDLSHTAGTRPQRTRPILGWPLSYDLRPQGKLTAVRDQGGCGSCWTFGTYASLESYLMAGDPSDFSENNLKNTHGFDLGHCAGGHKWMSSAYLSRWSGPVDEDDDPYSDTDPSSPGGLSPLKHVQEVIFIPDRAGSLDNDTIKEFVSTYGAVMTSMYWTDTFFNSSTNAYYYNAGATANHSVAIVGWNDSYPKGNFKTNPAGDGAFIIRNSWGPSWGESGYFYISYYDAKIGLDNAMFVNAESTSNYDHAYAYDPLGWVTSAGYGVTTAWFANVFTAADDHVLRAVSFYTPVTDSAYTIHIYIDEDSGPTSGTLVRTVSGTISWPGYHTIPVEPPSGHLVVSSGQVFSAVVQLTTPGDNNPIPIEYPQAGYASTATASAGESWVSPDGSSWQDLTTAYANTSVCLKVFADVKPTAALVSGLRFVPQADGTLVRWRSAFELGTVGFELYRHDAPGGEGWQVPGGLVPARHGPAGGLYQVLDPAPGAAAYSVVELDGQGRRTALGPFSAEPEDSAPEPWRSARPIWRPARLERPGAAPVGRGGARRIAAVPRLKIDVTAEGWYALTAAAIADAWDLPEGEVRQRLRRGQLGLRHRGQAVPVELEPDGRALRFYALPTPTVYSAASVYWLEPSPALSLPQRCPGRSPGGAAPQDHFVDALEIEQDRMAVPALAVDPQEDYWVWQALVAGAAGASTFAHGFELDHLAAGAGEAWLQVRLRGASRSEARMEHHATVAVNGVQVAELRWQGQRTSVTAHRLDASLLRRGPNTVAVTAHLDPGVPFSVIDVDGFELSYPRDYAAEAGALAFSPRDSGPVTVTGFSSPEVSLLDVTDPLRPTLLSCARVGRVGQGYGVTLEAADSGRRYLAAEPRAPASWRPAGVDLRVDRPGASYVIVAADALAEPAERLAALHRARGLEAAVFALSEVHDSFADGAPEPIAIQRLLAHAAATWPEPPRYAVLIGSGSYDYRGLTAPGPGPMPPLLIAGPDGLVSSDMILGDVDGDGLPDVPVGRLPAASAAELDLMVDAIARSLETRDGAWSRQALLLADDPDYGGDFTASSEALAAQLRGHLPTRSIDLRPGGVEDARSELAAALEGGVGVVTYFGHAGLDRLAAEGLLTRDDLPGIAPPARTPVVLAMTCVVGRHEIPGATTLAEALLLAEGGAAAVYAPSGLSQNRQAEALARAVLGAALARPDPLLGDAIVAALPAARAAGVPAHTLLGFTLFGDPALPLWRGN